MIKLKSNEGLVDQSRGEDLIVRRGVATLVNINHTTANEVSFHPTKINKMNSSIRAAHLE